MKRISIERIVANRYNHLLTMLLLFLWTAPFVERDQRALGYRLITIALLCIIVVCLRATVANKRMFIICLMIVGLAMLCDIAGKRIQDAELSLSLIFISASTYAIFLAITIVILMRNMFKSHRITADIIVGGICIYLVMGILWAISFGLLIDLDPDALTHQGPRSLYYFSFTTLTTLGYGDIIPTSDLARALTTTEAIAGQLYLTVFVARLVGLHIAGELRYTEKPNKSENGISDMN